MRTTKHFGEYMLLVLFFLSGSSALIYQVIWQKLLFTAFGVNLQSVSIIVSAFMLGLGIGALAGGWISDRYGDKQILYFIIIEVGIGIFGLISYELIRYIGDVFVLFPLSVIALVNFFMLLVPTALMGATLPILVSYMYRRSRNVGVSIGALYFSNTCGASVGSFFSAFVLLVFFSYSETLHIAAAINFAVALLIYMYVYE